MSTKMITRFGFHASGGIPLVWPMEVELTVHWEVDGLPEVGEKKVTVSRLVNPGTTFAQFLSGAKAELKTILETQGDGGHSVQDGRR